MSTSTTATSCCVILDSKFGKSREVVLHDSTMNALRDYGRLRDERFPQPRCEAFFVSTRGTRLRKTCIHHMFTRLVQTAGLKPRSPGCRPRLHDFRHYADGGVMRPAGLFGLVGALPVVILSA